MCYDSDLAGFLTAYQTMSRYEPACRCWALWTAGRRRRLRTQALIHERRQSAAVRLSETHTHIRRCQWLTWFCEAGGLT